MRACVTIVLLILLFIYIVVGGVVFHFLEWENEQTVRTDTTLLQKQILEEYPCLDEAALKRLVAGIVQAYDNGVLLVNNNSTETEMTSTNWDWYSAIFFATTVVTTIGYGNISPSTFGGQIFALCFAVFGIPLCLIVLGAIGEGLHKLLSSIQRCCCGECKSPRWQKFTQGLVLIVIGTGLFMLIPAAIFTQQEDWTYWESCYYAFITLTTIGFGDYVAGVEPTEYGSNGHGVYRLCIAGWILIGLAWMSSVIALYQSRMEQVIDRVDDQEGSISGISEGQAGNEKADIRDFQNLAFIESNQGITHTGEDGTPSTQL